MNQCILLVYPVNSLIRHILMQTFIYTTHFKETKNEKSYVNLVHFVGIGIVV
jgi:hypothetical protein